jgi:hypothetical protein
MLDSYIQRTMLLLNDPSFERFNEGDLQTYVNMARGQIAGEAECIQFLATLAVDSSTQQYSFASINIGGLTTSVLGVLNVRQISYAVASGYKPMHSRSWPYFQQYTLSQPVPTPSTPSSWAQLGQGAAGTLYVNALDGPYTLTASVVGYPVTLVDDSTPEAIPYQFTDAVPFFGAYFAALTIGDGDRADKMYGEYNKFMARARGAATAAVLPGNFAQAPDPFATNRLGLTQQRGGQA